MSPRAPDDTYPLAWDEDEGIHSLAPGEDVHMRLGWFNKRDAAVAAAIRDKVQASTQAAARRLLGAAARRDLRSHPESHTPTAVEARITGGGWHRCPTQQPPRFELILRRR